MLYLCQSSKLPKIFNTLAKIFSYERACYSGIIMCVLLPLSQILSHIMVHRLSPWQHMLLYYCACRSTVLMLPSNRKLWRTSKPSSQRVLAREYATTASPWKVRGGACGWGILVVSLLSYTLLFGLLEAKWQMVGGAYRDLLMVSIHFV